MKDLLLIPEKLTLQTKKIKVGKFTYTNLYLNGKLKATIPITVKQPNKNKKHIILNCFKYRLEFI